MQAQVQISVTVARATRPGLYKNYTQGTVSRRRDIELPEPYPSGMQWALCLCICAVGIYGALSLEAGGIVPPLSVLPRRDTFDEIKNLQS